MLLRLPDSVRTFCEGASDSACSVTFDFDGTALGVDVESVAPVRYIRLRWNFSAEERRPEPVRVLGDAWERAYGDLEWRGIVPERYMPWYFAVSDGSDLLRDARGRLTECFGVRVRPGALCFWQYDPDGATLWLDVRSGGAGVRLGSRTLRAAEIVTRNYRDLSAFAALSAFCRVLCTDPILPESPVHGSNNWYYAYGQTDEAEALADCAQTAKLFAGTGTPPYAVLDDGWQKYSCDAPWDCCNERFSPLPALAERIRARGVLPGIWVRFLGDMHREAGLSDRCRLLRNPDALDPSQPEVLDYVVRTAQTLAGAGFSLIKHDYSTYDLFGNWGLFRPQTLTDDGWTFADNSRTSAEIVLGFYRALRDAVPGTLLLGCNTISHLCAGLVELNRTGDDTSGREWTRTRRYGVNTLAFRLPQNDAFYRCDADCVGVMDGRIPWELNKRWTELLSRSGTPLFLSLKPGALTPAQLDEVAACAARTSAPHALIPLDWMENAFPSRWLCDGEELTFDWYDAEGCDSFQP